MTVPDTGRQNDQVRNSGTERAKSEGRDVNGSEKFACHMTKQEADYEP